MGRAYHRPYPAGESDRPLALAILVEILNQPLARQILAGLDDLGDATVLDLEPPRLAALALELEAQLSSVHLDVRVAQSCETVAFVLLGIIVVADSDQCG